MSFLSIAAPIAGALLGGISGGKGQKSVSTSRPYLPDNYQKGYDTLLQRGNELLDQPFSPAVATRADGSDAYGGLFNNPELTAIQADADRKYFDSLINPKKKPAATQEILAAIKAAKTQQDAWKAATMLSTADAAKLTPNEQADIQGAYNQALAQNNWKHMRY